MNEFENISVSQSETWVPKVGGATYIHILSGHFFDRHVFLDTKIISGVVEVVSNAKLARVNLKWKYFVP